MEDAPKRLGAAGAPGAAGVEEPPKSGFDAPVEAAGVPKPPKRPPGVAEVVAGVPNRLGAGAAPGAAGVPKPANAGGLFGSPEPEPWPNSDMAARRDGRSQDASRFNP